MPPNTRYRDWYKDIPEEHQLYPLHNAAFLVVDWILTSPSEGAFVWVPHATAFKNMEELCEHIDKPCTVPTATRVIRTVNAQSPPPQFRGPGTGFRTWAVRSARQNSANLSCFSWVPYLTPRRFSPGKPPIDLLDASMVGETCCSFDCLALCKDRQCVADRHAFSLDLVAESGAENWTYRYNACPRRISVLVQNGQPYGTQKSKVYPDDPAYVVLACEDSPHDDPSWEIPGVAFAGTRTAWEKIVSPTGSDVILQSIFESIGALWTDLVAQAVEHGRQLEDRVYAHPDDDSEAKALWAASKNWMTMERLLRCQITVLQEFEETCHNTMTKFVSAGSDGESDKSGDGGKTRANKNGKEIDQEAPVNFGEAQKVLKRCLTRVQDDLTKPTTNLLDMLYKSVAIRDTRLSLQLNASLWRLSWITFIFLPLTFLCGFFGMNVDLFTGNPSVKWYFISAAGLLGLSVLLWVVVKVVQRYRIKYSDRRKSNRYIV